MRSDIIIIGAGIAGAAAAYFLCKHRSVVLLEMEEHAGYHATGRSAAVYTENYGNDVVSALVRASRGFLNAPPRGFADYPVTHGLGLLTIAAPGQQSELDAAWKAARARVPDCELRSAGFALEKVPVLSPEQVEACIWEPRAQDIDVDLLFRGYLRGVAANGGKIVTGARVEKIARAGGNWRIAAAGLSDFEAPIVIDAAGAWADQVGALAGAMNLGLQPRRRTVLMVKPPGDVQSQGWPMVSRVDGTLYFRPSAGEILVSPADATPSVPCDAQPDEIDIATAIARLEDTTTLRVRGVRHRWAGLRSFVADEMPVAGWDPRVAGFLWLAGQGGAGVKTSPALGQLAASLVLESKYPELLTAAGITPGLLGPERLLPGAA
jgi:D-arginine dehydrogenase